MAHWQVEPDRPSLHGIFSRDLPPILTIDPGDIVQFRTLDAAWAIEPRKTAALEDRPKKFEPRNPETDSGHCLCGPIAIKGAKPGMVLKVEIQEVKVGSWGWTSSGGWPHRVHQRLGTDEGDEVLLLWQLDHGTGLAIDQHGRKLKMRPFMGVMGMPPDLEGNHPTPPPRRTGGNLDCKELIAGTTLYLPIEVEGGLFSVGDGHAVQADGEVCVTGIECPMDKVVLKFDVMDWPAVNMPRAITAESYISLGVHEDLHEASMLALSEMISWMGELYGYEPKDALALASLVVDMRITQLVNGVIGAHAVLRKDAFK